MQAAQNFFHKKQRTDGKPSLEATRIELCPGSWIELIPLPIDLIPTVNEFEALWNQHPDNFGKVVLFGKAMDTPRWQQAYGKDYHFSGLLHTSLPFPPMVERYLEWCRERAPTLNSGVINWYKDGTHCIYPHSDSERGIVPCSEIFCISLGADRYMHFEPKDKSGDYGVDKKVKLLLRGGTLLVMGGTTQQTHKHSLPRDKLVFDRRISLTFRSFR